MSKAKAIRKVKDAPGLDWRARETGEPVPYWLAPRKVAKAGYPIKSVRLDPNMTDAALAAKCQALQLEMKSWIAGGNNPNRDGAFDGTISSLVRHYETAPTSRFCLPYKKDGSGGIKFNTKESYQQWNGQIDKAIGSRLLCNIKQPDLIEFYDGFAQPKFEGGKRMLAKAQCCMRQFQRLLAHGVSFELPDCERILKIIVGVESKKGSRNAISFKGPGRRKGEETQLTFEQVLAFRDKAHERGNHAHALATVIQFESLMRQADVIGQWWPPEEGETAQPGPLVSNRGDVWRGLTWGVHITPDLKMIKPTSKSSEQKAAVFDFTRSPLIMEELGRIPMERRIGPVVISDRTGKPFLRKAFHKRWRELARMAGIPDETQNRDARAGGNTEAWNAGARIKDTARQSVHTEEMNRTYIKETMEASNRVTEARLAHRAKKANKAG